MSAMIANDTVINAPAPRPCRARKTMSCIIPPPINGSRTELAAQPAQRGAGEKQHDADHEDRLPAVLIAQLAVDRHRNCRRQQVRRRHPCVHRQSLQLLNDARHGRRNDGLIERAQQHDDGERSQRSAAGRRRKDSLRATELPRGLTGLTGAGEPDPSGRLTSSLLLVVTSSAICGLAKLAGCLASLIFLSHRSAILRLALTGCRWAGSLVGPHAALNPFRCIRVSG